MAKINVRLQYPYSREYEWITYMDDIDLDEERKKDILNGKGFVIKSPKPIKDDLKDPNGIFSTKYGPTLDDMNAFQDRYKCQCGYMRSKIMNESECPLCHTRVKYIDDDFSYFGWIILKEKYHIIHPSLYMTLCKFFGPDRFNDIIHFTKEVDKDGKIKERKPSKNSPFNGIGMMEFYDRYDEIIDYYANKFSKSQSKQEYYYILKRKKNTVFTHSIPVFTTLLRPYRVDGSELHFEGTNAIYKILAHLVAYVNNDHTKMANKELIQKQYLINIQDKIKELYDEINNILSGKKGQIRQLYGGRFNFTSRSVIVPTSTLQIDEVVISYQALCGLLQQVIINILHKSYNMSYNGAYVYFDQHRKQEDPIIVGIINGLINARKAEGRRGIPLVINRNPTISFGGVVGVYCVGISNGYTMGISLQIIKGLAADFDGDTLNLLYIINREFEEGVMAIFNPRNNFMISKNDGMFNPEVNHQRDTIINGNTLIRLGRDKYTEEQLAKIALAKTMP